MSKQIIDKDYCLAQCKCGCHFLYEKTDTRFRGSIVECPDCGNRLPVEGHEVDFFIANTFLSTIALAEDEEKMNSFCHHTGCENCPYELKGECMKERTAEEWREEFRKWQEAKVTRIEGEKA